MQPISKMNFHDLAAGVKEGEIELTLDVANRLINFVAADGEIDRKEVDALTIEKEIPGVLTWRRIVGEKSRPDHGHTLLGKYLEPAVKQLRPMIKHSETKRPAQITQMPLFDTFLVDPKYRAQVEKEFLDDLVGMGALRDVIYDHLDWPSDFHQHPSYSVEQGYPISNDMNGGDIDPELLKVYEQEVPKDWDSVKAYIDEGREPMAPVKKYLKEVYTEDAAYERALKAAGRALRADLDTFDEIEAQ